MALSSHGGHEDPLATVIKDAIAECTEDGNGALVEAALTEAVATSAYSRTDVEHEFEELKKRGEIYVLPAEDEDRAKVTP